MPSASNSLISRLETAFRRGPRQQDEGVTGTHIKKNGARLAPDAAPNPVAAMAAEAFKTKQKDYRDACDEREETRKTSKNRYAVDDGPSAVVKPSDIIKDRRQLAGRAKKGQGRSGNK